MLTQLVTAVAFTIVGASVALAADVPAQSHLRPPAVPLITCDPYFSLWSASDALNTKPTTHWTGKEQHLTSLVRIDGKVYRLMGDRPAEIEAAKQTNLTVTPTRSIYTFEQAGVQITMTFTTPLLPDDIALLSRPVGYLTWSAKSLDGSHDVSVYIDADGTLAVNTPEQTVVEQRGSATGLTTLRVGTVDQPVLGTKGDDRRIDWGYFYLASDSRQCALLPAADARDGFAKDGKLAEGVEKTEPADAKSAPVLAMAFPLGKVTDAPATAHVLLAYDDILSIRYFNEDLKAYWRKDGMSFEQLLTTADKQYDDVAKKCETFDNELIDDMHKIGGDAYVQIGVLAWRQALAAQKVCTDNNGQPLMFSKENHSNGCIGTVDVLYPAAPQMIAFAPSLLEASLTPLMDYSASPRWKHDSAPHDMGTYPLATGQVYGGGEGNGGMPVEESGNLLILHAALAKAKGNAEFSAKYWPTLTKWKTYLQENGIDPADQLTTDDFAGRIARNSNLSAKAIMGIASYGMLADMLGHKDEAADAMKVAQDGVKKWMELARDGDHYGLVFGDKGKGTWSQKYNIVWDTLLGFHLFPDSVVADEFAFYRTKMHKYGLPLDSRKDYTKTDWELWTATMAQKHEDFQMIVDPIALWLNETTDRAPMGDWYFTSTPKKQGFQARSVVGGCFIPFLKDEAMWKKWASRDTLNPHDWAAGDFRPPQKKVIVAAADTEPAMWKYTTTDPGGNDWNKPDFDDSSWKSGKSGFGTRDTPNTSVNTVWDGSDIWIRREFELPSPLPPSPMLYLFHDEDCEVYINGVRTLAQKGFNNGYDMFNINNRAMQTLKSGKNTIAIHCHQTVNGQYIDAGIVEQVKAK